MTSQALTYQPSAPPAITPFIPLGVPQGAPPPMALQPYGPPPPTFTHNVGEYAMNYAQAIGSGLGNLTQTALYGTGQLGLSALGVALGAGQASLGGAQQLALGLNASRRRRRRPALEGPASSPQNTMPNPFVSSNSTGGFNFGSTPFIKLDQTQQPPWTGPIFEELASTLHGNRPRPPAPTSIPDTGGASSSVVAHAPHARYPRRKVSSTKMKMKTSSAGTKYALPIYNPAQGTADMLPSGSNLAGAAQGKVDPNTTSAMPNVPATTGLTTESSSVPVRRAAAAGYGSGRKAIKSKKSQPSVKAPVAPPKRRMTAKKTNSYMSPPAAPTRRRITGKVPKSSVPLGIAERPL